LAWASPSTFSRASREAEAHAGQRHVLHLGRSLGDAHKVAPLQHDLGLALPAFDLAVVAITRRDGEITCAQLHLPTLRIVTQRGHGGLHDLLQLGLNGRSIAPILAGRQGCRHPVLLDLHGSLSRQLHHIGRSLRSRAAPWAHTLPPAQAAASASAAAAVREEEEDLEN
jgi:hypothetical protein